MTVLATKDLLNKYGLICHTFAYNELPSSVQNKLCVVNNDALNSDALQDSYLSLIANVGTRFWSELLEGEKVSGVLATDRVDDFSLNIVQQLLSISRLTSNARVLYPGTTPAPLIQLGELAHWSTPSPLGLGLHSTYGPWLAYRALVKTAEPLQNNPDQHTQTSTISPCISCDTTPCVTACPSDAVSIKDRFNISRCADYRVQPTSLCAARCHARNACPVGIEYRQSDEQHAYHMTHALQALVNWANKS